jgi:hypothetical protein
MTTAIVTQASPMAPATQTYCTSGSDITRILADPTTEVNITVRFPLTPHENPILGKRIIRYAVAQTVSQSNTLTFQAEAEGNSQTLTYNAVSNIQWVNNSGGLVQFVNNSGAAVNFFGQGFVYAYGQIEASGIYLGATLTGSVAGYSLNAVMLEYESSALFGSSAPL